MRIEIRNRYRPFTHRPGAYVILPFSYYALQVFPTKIFVLEKELPIAEVDFCLGDAPESFFTELDLEKGCITVHGTASGHFFRYFVFVEEGKIVFHLDKAKGECFKVVRDENALVKFEGKASTKEISLERLSFGNFKKQNFEDILDREDMQEVLPLWHAMAKFTSFSKADFENPSLLSDLREAILQENREQVIPLFKALFKTGFKSLFYPQMKDNAFQGYNKPPLTGTTPLALITEGASLMRSLFVRYETDTLTLLPLVPKELFSGRITGFPFGDSLLDLEWRSGKLMKAFFKTNEAIMINLILPKEIKSFRVRDLKNCETTRQVSGEPLTLKGNTAILLDRFIH